MLSTPASLSISERGDGTFSTALSTGLQTTASGAGTLLAGDFNEDGKLDLIVAAANGSQGESFSLEMGMEVSHSKHPLFLHSILSTP